MLPVIGLTAGDCSGVGPEILSAAIEHFKKEPALLCGCKLTVIGETVAKNLGSPSSETSLAAFAALEEAAKLAMSGEIAAVVTGPVSKCHLQKVGFPFPGQTEFFAARAGVENFAMLLTGGKLTVALVTIHLALREAIANLRADEIVRVGKLLVHFLKRRGLKNPRIAVAGLNPHAGEDGKMGREEKDIIEPAVSLLKSTYPEVSISGPLSPDTVFYRAVHGEFDAVLCMYHDQGLIPLKLHAFHEGVNTTLGLPFIRTSPDHGTAYDLAGKGIASPASYIAAIRLATELIGNRNYS